MLNDSLYSSDKMDWATPKFLFDALHAQFCFNLDVCATATNTKCENYFDVDKDGLSQIWKGNVWMNPPYGRTIVDWMRKAKSEVTKGHACVVVCLVPVRSDSKWWHETSMSASEVWLLDQRLEFEGSSNKAPFPTSIVIFNPGVAVTKLKSFNVRAARKLYGNAP